MLALPSHFRMLCVHDRAMQALLRVVLCWGRGSSVGHGLDSIPAIGSPRHWLAAPVEKTTVGVCRELIDDGEQMSGRSRGGMNLQPSRRERSGQRRGDRAGMQGDAKCVWRSTGQFNSRRPNQLIESGFGRPVGIPASQPIIANASDPRGQRREARLCATAATAAAHAS